jgi:hypothetical protein
MQKMILVAVLLFSLYSFGQKEDFVNIKYIPKEINYTYRLGDKTINLKCYQYGERKNILMINLHSDETTSVEAAKQVLQETGGVLLKIENNNERIVSFTFQGKTFRFDPNRIFSRKGIITSLQKFHQYSSHAVRKIEGFAKFVLNKIHRENKTLIALHNNDDGNYSIDSYANGEFSNDVIKVHVEDSQDKDNFFFTTDAFLHKSFVESKFNSALQNNKHSTDDGSLSVYYGKRKRSYVNVEAESGKREEQMKMIWFLLSKSEN